MQLAINPMKVSKYIDELDYTETPLFYIGLTRRNWFRKDKYILKEDVEWFRHPFQNELQGIFYKLNHTPNKKVSYLIDTSIFLEEQHTNNKVEEFLESIQEKDNPKIQSKLRFYASKLENLGMLLKWALNNKHPQTLMVLNETNETIQQTKKSFMKKAFSQMDNENLEQYSKDEEKIISKLMKYSFSSSELFIYNAYFIDKWFEDYHKMNLWEANFVITAHIEKRNNIIEVFQGQRFHKSCLFFEEMFGHFLDITSREVAYQTSSIHFFELFPPKEKVNIDTNTLKSISNWVLDEIGRKKKYSLPKEKWYTEVQWEILQNIGIKEMSILFEREIASEDDTKWLIFGKAYVGDKRYILFPLVEPDKWDSLNIYQKLLITYAICLYHDIVVENDFEIDTSNKEDFNDWLEIMMPEKPKHLTIEQKDILSKQKQESDGQKLTSKSRKQKEHWVSLHFRKLREGSMPSQEAIKKANKYNISIPDGFTFIDSYFKGKGDMDNIERKEQTTISALDIFRKALN